MKGKFIVIEGTDGSGKGTQVELLITRLEKEGHRVKMVDFPRYDNPSSFFVSKYLRGEYGTADDVGPYKASLFYALDRYDASFEIRSLLDEGVHVIANRYVSASMGHQAGKIENKDERDTFLDWLHHLEFEICGIPKPDQIIFLYVPPEIGQALVAQKHARAYTHGKKMDIHEADLDHLQKASQAYFYVAEKYHWTTIHCTKENEILPIETIHDMIYRTIHVGSW